MKQFLRVRLTTIAWGLAAVVLAVGVSAWAQRHEWLLLGMSSYEIFPVFGIIAFSLMWCHYIIGGIKAGFGLSDLKLSKSYFEVTAGVVLFSLLIHPSLLIWQLWRDGFGLPPASYVENYVAPGLAWAVYIATVSWLAFMAFELRRWHSDKKWWKYVLYANDVAIWAVYIHGLKLGADVAAPWLQYVWWGYGLLLAVAFVAIYRQKWFAKSTI